MQPKQKITLSYTYRDDYLKLKEEAEKALEIIKPSIEKDLQDGGDDIESRKSTMRSLEKQMQRFMLTFTNKSNQLVEYRTDR